jgi:hypothetical protein
MNQRVFITAGFVVAFVALVALTFAIFGMNRVIQSQDKAFRSSIAALQDSVQRLQRQADSLTLRSPGLGEYMSTIQLHIGKLWFAGQSANWDLASYEVNELGEAIEGAEALHAVRDSVNVTAVLQSVQNTQIELLKQAVHSREQAKLRDAYGQTLDACNGCHRAAGFKFIHIVTPTSQPVTNQLWKSIP